MRFNHNSNNSCRLRLYVFVEKYLFSKKDFDDFARFQSYLATTITFPDADSPKAHASYIKHGGVRLK